MNDEFEPLIIGFTCNWCSYRAADLAGMSRIKYPSNVRLIRLMCSGRLDPSFVVKALKDGADGVLITGCHPGECHYVVQNHKMLKRYHLLRRMLAQFGIEPERVKLVWASAAEGKRFADEVTAMVEDIRQLGPLSDQASAIRHQASGISNQAPAISVQASGASQQGLTTLDAAHSTPDTRHRTPIQV